MNRRVALLAAAVLALLALPPAAPAAWIWVEGEAATKSTLRRHPWYDQVKKDQFSGGGFAGHFSERGPGEAAYEFTAPAAGEYDLWLRANPVQAQMAVRLNDGPWTEIDLARNQQQNVNVAADGKVDLRFLAWIKAGRMTLKAGANRLDVRLHGGKQNHGYLDCFVLANEPFQPRGMLKPGQAPAPASSEDAGWFAFAPPADTFAPGAGFDLRPLNEKAAGDGGFIGVRDGHFIHTRTGRPLRFWGVNGPPHDLEDPQLLGACARSLARYGVNLVRIHGGIYDESGVVNPGKVQRKAAVVAAMKQEGIYSHLSIYFPLWMRPKPGTAYLAGYDGKRHPFAALEFNKDFQKQYQSWWKAVLLTADAKTGRRLVDEPALAGVEIQNEDSYFFWTFSAANLPDEQLRLLEAQFGEWLKARYGSLDAALARWNGLKNPRDRPEEGRLGFRPLWNMFKEKTPRDRDTARFLLESQRTFYDETYRFLRGLGFKGVITCSNWATASPEVFGPLEKYSYTVGDFIDRHGYFGCSLKGPEAGWSVREGHTYADRSALRFETEPPGPGRLFSHPAMDPHYAGKPSMISETTWCRPNRYRSEAPLFYAAYGALQDSDALIHFALDSTTWAVKPGYFMQPWTLMSPAMMGQFPAAALIYRQGLVAPGDLLVDLNLKVSDLADLKGTPLPQDAALDELRLKDVPLTGTPAPGGLIDPLVHLAGRTSVRFSDAGGPARVQDLSRLIDRTGRTVTSTHGQVRLDYGKGVLVLNAPAAQGASGSLAAAGTVETKDLTLASDLELGHIVAVSLDGRPLATSGRILLQVMTEERPSGFRTEPAAGTGGAKRITALGHDPWLVREVRGTVRFKRPDAAGLPVTRLDHAGYPAGAAGTAAEIRLAPATVYYLVGK